MFLHADKAKLETNQLSSSKGLLSFFLFFFGAKSEKSVRFPMTLFVVPVSNSYHVQKWQTSTEFKVEWDHQT